jgi:hypothetical protein
MIGLRNRVFAGLLALIGSASGALAQDLSSSITCLRGSVPAADYAELTQKLSESLWDRKGGVALASDVGGVRLRVVDTYQNSVCEETANNSTYCTFRVDLSNVDDFTIIVDNRENSANSNYRLCAF